MNFDPENKIVQLCAEGMNAELEGRRDAAGQLFREAWEKASGDFEKFTAAHYLARAQTDAEAILHWNLVSLEHAEKISDFGSGGHFASLHLNIAKSYEQLGRGEEAFAHYRRAAATVEALPASQYGSMIRFGIHEGLRRTGPPEAPDMLRTLIETWCARCELKALALVLPAYLAHVGAATDDFRLHSALRFLSATRSLPPAEQALLDTVIAEQAAAQ